MLHNLDKELLRGDRGLSLSEMDDGGRCLADVINDPQLLQSFLENDNGANGSVESQHVKAALVASKLNQSSEGVNVNINNRLTTITSVLTDSKQVDHVTSTGENTSPPTTIIRPSSVGGFIIDDKHAFNIVSSSVGLIPLSGIPTAAATSISFTHPSMTSFSTASASLRAPSPAVSWPQTSIQIAAPRNSGPMTMQLPQQLIVPAGTMPMTQSAGGLSQFVLTSPRPQHTAQLPPGIQPGQLLQIIHTPNGTQILPANTAAPIQQMVNTSCSNTSAKTSSNSTSSRSNKQILPKPPGSGPNTNNNVQSNSNNKTGQGQGNALKVINSLQQSNATQFTTSTLSTSTAPTQTAQQYIIGAGTQPSGVIAAGPQGTFLLNHLIPGLGPQPILIQGNIGNVPGSVQLTLRPQPHASPVMSMNNTNITSPEQNSALLNALANGPQSASTKPSHTSAQTQPQTIVIPNHASAVNSAPPQGMVIPTAHGGMMMTAGPRGTPNFILTRPQQLLGAHSAQSTVHSGPQQFLQIQTPNGPVLIALQTHAPMQGPQMTSVAPQNNVQTQNSQTHTQSIQIGNAMIPIGASQTVPNVGTTHAHPALQALLNTHQESGNGQTILQSSVNSVPTSNTVILTPQNQLIASGHRPQITQQHHTSPNFVVSNQQQSKSSVPSVNLAELLKEHGILPELSPPSSPLNNSNELTSVNLNTDVHSSPQQTVVMMPNHTPNIVLTQNPVNASNAAPQLRLSVAPDGSVILHPHISISQPQLQSQSNPRTLSESLKDNSGLGSSQPSPDSTTPTIDATSTSSSVSTTQTSTVSTVQTTQSQSCSALLDQLNTAPVVKVPDIVTSLALQHGPNNSSNHSSEDQKPSLIPLTVQNINNDVNNDPQRQTILTIPVTSGDSTTVSAQSNASHVIRIGNCDTIPTSLVFTTHTTPTTVCFTSPKQGQTGATTAPTSAPTSSSYTNGSATTVIDHNGVPMIQVSPNNHEFLQRLETQLKGLLALKSPTQQQKDLLQELLVLQQKMIYARGQSQSDDQKVVLTAAPQTLQIQLSPHAQQTIQQTQQKQTQNVNLVNLLNQSPVNQTSAPQQIRLLTSTNTTPVSGTSIQLGNQIITFTAPPKQQLQSIKTLANNQGIVHTHQTILRPQSTPTTVYLRLQSPSATTVTVPSVSKQSNKQIDTHSENEKRNIRILKSIQQQLSVDQSAALKPDTKKPFKSRDDACKRLLRYHVFNTPTMSHAELEKSDELFETVSQHLLHRKQQLYDKFRILLLKQTMKETASSEHVMLDRMFISEETASLKADKELVAEGKVLDLPPLPESWYQMIRISIEEEELKLNINRKRKSSIAIDDEYCGQSSQRRHEEQEDDSDESEDEDEDSDEDEDDGDKDAISNFLSIDNINDVDYYSNVNYDHQNLQIASRMNGHVPLNNYVDGTAANDYGMYTDMSQDNSQDWTNCTPLMSNPQETRRISWSPRFGVPESEAAVAVESILTAEDEGEADMSVDLSGIDGLDDNLDDDNDEDDDDEGEDDDDEDEDEDGEYMTSDQSHQQHADVQMQCAIKSILDMPVQPSPSHSSPYLHSDNNQHHSHMNEYRGYYIPSQRYQRHHLSGGILPDHVVNRHTACADPILDEAVKSILS